MSKMQRTKGHGYERRIASKLRHIFPAAKRHLEYQAGEANGVDLDNTGRLRIQCKRYAKYAPIAKIKEVQADGIHVLVTRGDRERDVACLYLDDLIAILEDVGVVYE